MLIVLRAGNNSLSWFLLTLNLTVFNFATLEEYYTGSLDLPPMNGVSDGSVLIIGLYLAIGIVGSDKMALNVRPGDWMHIEGIKSMTPG